MANYELTRSTGQCSVTGRAFSEGEAFYSVVIETAEGFERRDIAEDSWDGPPEDAVCHFKTKIAKKDQPRKMFVDDDVLIRRSDLPKYLPIAAQTAARWASGGEGPRFIKVGRRLVAYRAGDLREWLQGQVRENTIKV